MVQEAPARGLPIATVPKDEFTERFKVQYVNWESSVKGVKDKEKDDYDDRVDTNSKLEEPKDKIFGFENEIKSMENFLLDQKVYKEFKSLVIVGEYGVGKSTLCKMIFNDDKVKSVYAPRIWVSMYTKEAKEGEDKKISVLRRILKELGVKDDVLDFIHKEADQEVRTKQERGEADGETTAEKEISALLYALHLKLKWKKYLIVFDDVREEDKWDQKLEENLGKGVKWGKYLSDGFPKGSGGRVIYTTREETMAEKLVAEEYQIHRLWPLSDHQYVWKIYEYVVEKNKKDPPRNDKKCIDELMNKSRGLPLAVRLIAELDPVFLDDETVEDPNAAGAADQANNQSVQASNTAT